ncbi:CAunnamed protein product [Biomphalaria glabrata]|nr:CAunnamed protein product [Biomphalaria glabrata]
MLSESEKKLCGDILKLLPDEDLFSLSSTVTCRVVDVNSRKEAEKAVVAFTQSIDEFFKRRKISKDIILKYMYQNGLPVPKDAEKDRLASHIIQTTIRAAAYEQATPPPTNSNSSNCQISLPQPSMIHSPTNITVNLNVNYFNNTEIKATNPDQANAEGFVQWFYDMLNSYNPVLNKDHTHFGPQHFWENAQLFLSVNTKNSKVEDIANGNILVCERLLKFPMQDLILFLPNVSADGVKTKSDSHGLKLILVCGTLHVNNQCVGVFQQSFGLIRNPLSPDIWKIKITCLKMDEHTPLASPRLQDCLEISAIEQHTVKALEQAMLS